MLDVIEMNPEGEIRACIIWLHGLGADGSDFVPLVPQLGVREQGVRFVFPHAPVQPVTINGGMRMRAWYDIRFPDLGREIDADGIRRSAEALAELVERETAMLETGRIVLAGFSQGGVIALHAGLCMQTPVAGIIALSTYLGLPEVLTDGDGAVHRATPIFLGHGLQDPVVPLAMAETSRDYLLGAGCPLTYHNYPMQHAVCAEEVADIAHWLGSRL